MNNDKTKSAVLIVMMLVLAGVVYWQFTKGAGDVSLAPPPASGEGSSAAPVQPQSQLREVEVDLDRLVEDIQEVGFEYIPGGRNPMTPLVGRVYFASRAAAELGEGVTMEAYELLSIAQRMELTGILWSAQDPVAVIDNVVVRPGHQFPGVNIRVHQIQPGSVTLEVEDSLIELTLEER